jgi:pimeloyl-ACP methyl ester carboxylesterase
VASPTCATERNAVFDPYRHHNDTLGVAFDDPNFVVIDGNGNLLPICSESGMCHLDWGDRHASSFARVQQMPFVTTPTLRIAYEVGGPSGSSPVLLLHGWPDDVRTFDHLVPVLQTAGFRTIAPYLRGFGETTFISKDIMRSGEIVAMAQDAIDLADALKLGKFAVVGHDWGARIAYVLAILVPERVTQMVTIAVGWQAGELPTPSLRQAQAYWYQWFMTTKRGRQLIRSNSKAFARIQWDNWSPPGWFNDAVFERTAKSFENPDWPDITWHSYSVRWGEADKDPRYTELERRVNAAHSISVSTLMIQGASDSVTLPESTVNKDEYFTGGYARRVIPDVGHFPTREAPEMINKLVLEFLRTR